MITRDALLDALTLLLLLAANADSQLLVGTPANPTQNVALGTTLIVTCSPADNSAAVQNLRWFGPKNYFDVSSGSSEANVIRSRSAMPRDPVTQDMSRIYTQVTGLNALSLNVENIQLTDSGKYSCRGKVQGIDSAFNVSILPYQPLSVQAASNQYLIRGNDFGLVSCSVQGSSPTVQWQMNGQDLSTSGSGKYETTASGLVVYNPAPSDAGRYTCRGLLPLTGAVQQVYINVDVYVPPLMLGQPVLLGTQGFGVVRQSAVLSCNATGYPAPQYVWFIGSATAAGTKEVTDVNFGTRFRPDASAGTLTILEIRLEDAGWYWCRAQNQAGFQTASVYLNVTMVAYFTWNQNSTDKNDGDTITLTCQSKAVPPANMQWLKWGRSQPYADGVQSDDTRIRVYQKFAAPTEELQAILPKEVWLEIKNATYQDMANYTCIATNVAGQNQTTQEIRVNFAPVFVNVTSKVYNWEGNVRNLTCCTIAWPIPTWTWTYLGTVVTNDDNRKIFYEYTNSSLQIRIPYVTLHGSLWGTYSCIASNNRGTASATVMLEEAQLPDAPYNLSVKAVTPTSMILDVYLAPPLTIPPILIEVRAEIPGGGISPVPFRFDLSQMHNMKIDNLFASTAYTIRVTARNERGLGARDQSRIISTLPIDRPYPVVIVSGPLSSYTGSHLIMWEMTDNGGSPITQYTVKWRQASDSAWETRLIGTGSSYFVIRNLKPNMLYEAQVLATNIKGISDPPTPAYYFRTVDGVIPAVVLQQGNGLVPEAIDLGPLQVSHLIIIVTVGIVAVFLSIDMICCFTRHCGLFMCIYKTTVGRPDAKLPVSVVDMAAAPGRESVELLEPSESNASFRGPGSRSAGGGRTLDVLESPAAALLGAASSNSSIGRPYREAAGNRQQPASERPPKARDLHSPASAKAMHPALYNDLVYRGIALKPAYQSSESSISAKDPVPLPAAMQGPARPAMQGPSRPAMQGPARPSGMAAGSTGWGSSQAPSRESPYSDATTMAAASRGPSPHWSVSSSAPVPAARGTGRSQHPPAARPAPAAPAERGEAMAAAYDAESSTSSRDSRLIPQRLGETDVDAFDDSQSYDDMEISQYLGNRPADGGRSKLPSTATDI